jgi:hypothetical protein
VTEPGPIALSHPETAVACEERLRELRRSRNRGLLAAAALITVGITAVTSGADWVLFLAPIVGVALAGPLFSMAGLVNLRRQLRVLVAGPWVACAAVLIPAGAAPAPKLVLLDPVSGQSRVYALVTVQWRLSLADPGPRGVLWCCLDARGRAVVSRPGGRGLIWVRPTRWGQKRALRLAEERGLHRRAQPAQPALPAPPPAAPATPSESAPAAAARRRPRGVFRWVALAAVVLLGFGIAGDVVRGDALPVVLAVLEEDDEGNCTVRWQNPVDGGRERVTEYHCDPERSPSLVGTLDAAFVEPWGPHKGQLYSSSAGSPTAEVIGALGVIGALLLFLATAGGVIRRLVRWWRRLRRAPEPVPAWAGFAAPAQPDTGRPDPAAFRYARLAALAEEAEPWPSLPPSEADVRTVPWWRVRSLRRISGLPALGVCLAYTLASLLAVLWRGPNVALWLVFGVVGTLIAATSAWRSTRVIPAVVRAARAPVPNPARYVLLYSPESGVPVLVIYPASGGPDELPEAVLLLWPPGPQKDPLRGLPAPVGTADLRGWLDPLPTVVAWTDGRACWPLGPYQPVNPRSERGLAMLRELIGDEEPAAV